MHSDKKRQLDALRKAQRRAVASGIWSFLQSIELAVRLHWARALWLLFFLGVLAWSSFLGWVVHEEGNPLDGDLEIVIPLFLSPVLVALILAKTRRRAFQKTKVALEDISERQELEEAEAEGTVSRSWWQLLLIGFAFFLLFEVLHSFGCAPRDLR